MTKYTPTPQLIARLEAGGFPAHAAVLRRAQRRYLNAYDDAAVDELNRERRVAIAMLADLSSLRDMAL